jgi:hypothetical protein
MDTADQINASLSALHKALDLMGTGTVTEDLVTSQVPGASGASGVSGRLAEAVAGWDEVCFPVGWLGSLSPEEAQFALVGVERLRRRVDAAIVVLSQSLRAGRDTVASLTRLTHMSNADAKQYVRVARQCEAVPEMVQQLTQGDLSLEHASALASIDPETAVSLLVDAAGERVDEFRARVRKALVAKAGHGRRERQQAERSVRFSTTDEGSLKATIVLPEAEGVEFRNALDQLCDEAYRAKYPKRASTLGGHHAPPREQRLADALVQWMRGNLQGPGRPAVVVVIDAKSLECKRLPNDPVSPDEAVHLLQRAHVYGLIRDHTTGGTIRFGRNRRLATPLQKLLLAVRYGYCSVDGCYEPAFRADADHIVPYSRGGLTNDDAMQPLCGLHHPAKTETECGRDAPRRSRIRQAKPPPRAASV